MDIEAKIFMTEASNLLETGSVKITSVDREEWWIDEKLTLVTLNVKKLKAD